MDRAQSFIKECLFSRNFENPNKPIDEKRLQSTLLLLPTDGGVSNKLKRNRSKFKITSQNIDSDIGLDSTAKQPNYREISKNARSSLHDYVTDSRKVSRKVMYLANENKISERSALFRFLKDTQPELLEKVPQYSKFLPMHNELWLGYIKEVLNIPSKVVDVEKLAINGSAALLKLSMADYNGALLKVIRCKNTNVVGIEGIVVWDGQKTFIMITRGELVDQIKIIPKKGTVFGFEIPINEDFALKYSILGDRFKYRSIDRAGRKFKSRRCDDMLYYIHT